MVFSGWPENGRGPAMVFLGQADPDGPGVSRDPQNGIPLFMVFYVMACHTGPGMIWARDLAVE